MTTDKEKCVEKAHALADEFKALYGVDFSCICNAGAYGFFDMTKYGKPCIQISGNIFSDDYYMTAWETETGKTRLYSSGYETIPKPVMILILNKLLKRKALSTKQMELF